MMETQLTDADLRRVLEAERLANARGDAERQLRLSGFAMSPQHRDARDILEEVRERHPRATDDVAYQVLRVLERKGLVRGRRLADSPTRFDPRTDSRLDLLCPRCKVVEEVEVGAEFAAAFAAAFAAEVREGGPRGVDNLSRVGQGACRACYGSAAHGRGTA